MNAGEFAKRRARIEHEAWRRGKQWATKAMASLMRQAGAIMVLVHGKQVAWRLPDGQTVCKKRRYRTEPEALLELQHVRDDPKGHKVPVRVYACPYCRGWHLTSQAK